MAKEIRNAKITSTTLGFEGHGILTWMIHLDYGGVSQGFGGYMLTTAHIKRVLEIARVDRWEDLKGKYVRAESEHHKVHRIGDILKDEWFNPSNNE